jgi:hypothetical protein
MYNVAFDFIFYLGLFNCTISVNRPAASNYLEGGLYSLLKVVPQNLPWETEENGKHCWLGWPTAEF